MLLLQPPRTRISVYQLRTLPSLFFQLHSSPAQKIEDDDEERQAERKRERAREEERERQRRRRRRRERTREGGEKLLARRNVTAILERRLQNCGPRLNIRRHVNESLSTAEHLASRRGGGGRRRGGYNAATFSETNWGESAVIGRYGP